VVHFTCEPTPATPKPLASLALALLKNQDHEDALEGCLQLNLDAIHLFPGAFSQNAHKKSQDKILARMQQKALTALKQAKKTWLTQITIHRNLQDLLLAIPQSTNILLDLTGSPTLPYNASPFTVFCGPEGGFSEAEKQAILQKDSAYTLSLGANRLRALHAPLYALGVLAGKGFPL
jgi:RsmE family RNA methyltransferase